MDTNNKPQDVNALLQKALKGSARPDAKLLASVKHELTKKERDILNKPRTNRPIRKVAIAIAATLALTTTVFAASTYFGSFDRLRGIVGNPRAEVLQPLEISSISGEQAIPESRYPAYDATQDRPPLAQTPDNNLEESGIRAEVVAVGVFDNVVDIYIMLEDLIGGRLDDYFQVSHLVIPANEYGIAALSLTPEIINRSDDGVITIRSREIFTHSVAGMELRYSLRGINYNINCLHERPSMRDLGIDFTAVTPQPSVLFRPDMSPGRSGSGIWSSAMHDAIDEKLINEGFAVLQPHLHDIEVDLGGVTAIISSIGIVEDRLHVQIYYPTPEARDMLGFGLQYYYGDFRTMQFGFSKDADGNLVRAEIGPDGSEAVQYQEFIFFDVDISRLSGYRMYGRSNATSTFDRLDLEWSVNFDVPVNDKQIVAAGLDVQYESVAITEVRVTPFLIQVVLDGEVIGLDAAVITINTTGGTISATGMGFSGSGMGSFFYDMMDTPLDLDAIISIEIAGEIIVF